MGLYVNPGNGALEDGLLQRENVLHESSYGTSLRERVHRCGLPAHTERGLSGKTYLRH